MTKRIKAAIDMEGLVALAGERMEEEIRTPSYRVADGAKIDWCACCGVNIRLYDSADRLVCKLILRPDDALRFGADLLRMGHEARELHAADPQIADKFAAAVAARAKAGKT